MANNNCSRKLFHFLLVWFEFVQFELVLDFILAGILLVLAMLHLWRFAWYKWNLLPSLISLCFLLLALYGLTTILLNLSYYIHIKQKQIQHDFDKFIEQIRHSKRRIYWLKYIHLNHRYAKVMREVKHYNQIISRCLNLIFFIFTILISYMTYLLFLTDVTNFTFITLSFPYSFHIINLCCVIGTCASITTSNDHIVHKTRTLFDLSLQQKLCNLSQLDQVRQTQLLRSKYWSGNFIVDQQFIAKLEHCQHGILTLEQYNNHTCNIHCRMLH